ncbi:MAG: sulfatase-like hydrolase/transferase, partial [Treponema sp.]
MYLLITFIIITYLFAYSFNYLKNKKLKRNKSLLNLLLEVSLQVPISYLLTILYFRLIRRNSIMDTLNYIWKNKYNFVVKAHIVNFECLAIILFLSFLFKIEIKKINEERRKSYIFSFIFMFFVVQFIMLGFYFDAMFSDININQILFVLNMPITGTSYIIVIVSVLTLLLFPLCFSLFHLLLLKNNIGFVCTVFKKEKTFFPFKFNHKMILSFSLLVVAVLFFEFKLQVMGYVLKEFRGNSSFYEENYIPPKDVTFTFPEHKKNLIFIYLESTEAEVAYCAKENTNLIPELAEIAKNNLSFSHSDGIGGQIQVPGTDHSIASICCTHLGLPLLVNFAGQFYRNNSEYFFNGAYGLGNILQGGGYNCLFTLGSGTIYGGLGNLLKGHGFEVKDLDYYRSINKVPKDYFVWWGIEDIKVVEYAKEELTHLASLDKPFAFSVFFEDTHTPGGYFDEECENKYPKQIHNVFINMSKRINNFIEWIKEQPFYENSVIVILGDHLYMGQDLYDDGRSKSKRHAYNAFINTGKSGEHSKNRK